MPRSGADARRRLSQAALELYSEQGFDGTTTAEIAERAGVNHRTFFRHFPDKREVLFDGEADLRDALVAAVAAAPTQWTPYEVLTAAFRTAGRILEENRPFSGPRLSIIAATPALRERDLAKGEILSQALAEALQQRGVPASLADLAAHTGWATFHHAAGRWLTDPAHDLATHLDQAFEALRDLTAAPATNDEQQAKNLTTVQKS